MVISLSHLQATSQYAKDKEKTSPTPPPAPPALSACFALVHQIIFLFFIYYPDDYEVDVCFSLSRRMKL